MDEELWSNIVLMPLQSWNRIFIDPKMDLLLLCLGVKSIRSESTAYSLIESKRDSMNRKWKHSFSLVKESLDYE